MERSISVTPFTGQIMHTTAQLLARAASPLAQVTSAALSTSDTAMLVVTSRNLRKAMTIMSRAGATSPSKSNDLSTNPSLHTPQTPGDALQNDATDQPGLEVVPVNDRHKQVVQPEKEVTQAGYDFESREKQVAQPLIRPDGPPSLSHGRPKDHRICGLKRVLFWGLLMAALVFVLGLAIGLGVGLGTDDSSDSETQDPTTTAAPTQPTATPIADTFKIGSSISERYHSEEGAWNGTGIATNWQRFASNFEYAKPGVDNLVIYYQHHSGTIRWMRQTKDGDFTRMPSNQEIVAEDAKNSTPIAAVHLADYERGLKLWHIFYIDKDHKIRQRSGDNSTTSWTDGPINESNLAAYRGDLVGLHACWAGIGSKAPIRLWYASGNTTFEEYLFKDEEWKWQRSWEGYYGAAGVGCYSWSRGPNIYAGFVNTNNNVEIWYQNTSSSDGWRQTDVVVPEVHPASTISLSQTVCVVQKQESNELQVSKMTWQGENTTREDDRSLSLENVGDSVRGTRLATFSTSESGETYVRVFNQIIGDDITELKRGLEDESGMWSQNNIAPRN
ncbi:hypothetical protein Q7P37_008262 [Cladosporium fusiforme]